MKKVSTVRAVAIYSNPEKPIARRELPRLRVWLKRRSLTPLTAHQLDKADAVISLGGDGTILSIAPQAAMAGVPVLGVNTGRLGFMTAVDVKSMYKGLEQWLKGRWAVSYRLMLEVTVPNGKKVQLALNDAVIRTGQTTRVATVDVSIEKENLGRFTGDGVIVSTPTGSTAYSLAAQGPVVHPAVDALVLTPICAHSFTQRPVVFPAEQTLELTLRDTPKDIDVQLCLDGQRVFRLKNADRVYVRRSPYKLQLLHDPRVPYFGVLREKLLWGER